jgi:hypothetical protein
MMGMGEDLEDEAESSLMHHHHHRQQQQQQQLQNLQEGFITNTDEDGFSIPQPVYPHSHIHHPSSLPSTVPQLQLQLQHHQTTYLSPSSFFAAPGPPHASTVNTNTTSGLSPMHTQSLGRRRTRAGGERDYREREGVQRERERDGGSKSLPRSVTMGSAISSSSSSLSSSVASFPASVAPLLASLGASGAATRGRNGAGSAGMAGTASGGSASASASAAGSGSASGGRAYHGLGIHRSPSPLQQYYIHRAHSGHGAGGGGGMKEESFMDVDAGSVVCLLIFLLFVYVMLIVFFWLDGWIRMLR